MFIPLQAQGQIIIKERIELSQQQQSALQNISPNTGSPSQPFWIPLEEGQFLMLKSGELTLRFDEATLRQEPLSGADMLYLQRNGKQGIQLFDVPARDHLPETMHVNEHGCGGDRFLYTSDTTSLGVNVTKDATVSSASPGANNGLDSALVAGPVVSEEYTTKIFLEADLSGFQSPVTVISSDLVLQGINVAQNYDGTFTLSRVTMPWTETGVTWANQPGADSGSSLSMDAQFPDGSRGTFFTVTPIIESWLSGTHPNYGFSVSKQGEEANSFYSREGELTPTLRIAFTPPGGPADNPVFEVGYVEAGDTLSFNFNNFSLDPFAQPETPYSYPLTFSTGGFGPCTAQNVKIIAHLAPAYPDSMEVEMLVDILPNHLASGDSALVLPKLKFSNGRVGNFSDDQDFRGEIIAGTSYGTLQEFFSSDTADVIDDTEYGFRFLAADSLAADSAIAIIKVETLLETGPEGPIIIGEAPDQSLPALETTGRQTNSETTYSPTQQQTSASSQPSGLPLSGTGQVVVKTDQDTTLQITQELENELWPYLPDQNNNGDSRGDDRPGYNPADTTLTVLVKRGEEPLENASVVLRAEYQEGSGGHLHTNPLPMEDQGTFWGQQESGNPITLTTDADGIVRIDSFRTSQVSGEYIIRSFLEANSTIQDSLELEVKVPDLEDFADIESNGKWSLTGDREDVHESNH